MFLYTSNRLEYLAEALVKNLDEPLSSPLEKEIILVQSKGMAKWLSLFIAEKAGICANFSFLFPKAFAYEMFKRVSNFSENSFFDVNMLSFKIMHILPKLAEKKEFEAIKKYIEGKDEKKLYQISEKIADNFDNYIIYRPSMISLWEKKEEENWQAVLWREIITEIGDDHFLKAENEFFKVLNSSLNIKNLPERISVFSISTLPPIYLKIIHALSFFITVNIYSMNPCSHFWGDILSDKEALKEEKKYKSKNLSRDYLHIEKGNSLLACMGKCGKEFLNLIMEITDYNIEGKELFCDSGEKNLLSSIQSDILNLVERGKTAPKKIIDKNDDSIIINSCHTPLREVEILYDRILYILEKEENISCDDILIMTPDIEKYTPFIHAVFDTLLPFSIADRNARKRSDMIDAFFSIIELSKTRYGSLKVLSILEFESIRNKLEFNDSDIKIIKKWITDTNIRWGIDSIHKKNIGVPIFKENTWENGIEKLILGYAMQDSELFDKIAPYDNIDMEHAELLGDFINFTEKLFSFYNKAIKEHTLAEWSIILKDTLKTFFMENEEYFQEIQMIKEELSMLETIEEKTSFSEKLRLDTVADFLNKDLEKKGFVSEFLTGGITFCAALPMRSIPFKVICFMGLDFDSFPRRDIETSFNLMTKNYIPGDRCKRDDDRFLFLEALISAREKFYISYIGQSIKENSSYPPSTVVSELLDYIEQGFIHPAKNIKEHVLTEHKLQPFSPFYFIEENENFFTYNKENLHAAEAIYLKKKRDVSFITEKLPYLKKETINIKEIKRFFSNPTKYFLNERLSIFFETEKEPIETENFELKSIEKYKLENIIFKKYPYKKYAELYEISMQTGMLPHGAVGKSVYDNIYRKIKEFYIKAEEDAKGIKKNVNIDLTVNGIKINGMLDNFYDNKMLILKYGAIKPKDIIAAWIDHLILKNLDTNISESALIGFNPQHKENIMKITFYSLLSKEKAYSILSDLIEIFLSGLETALPFFTFSSYDFADAVINKKWTLDNALKKAKISFLRIDSNDAYYGLCFNDHKKALNENFRNSALKIYEPIFANSDIAP